MSGLARRLKIVKKEVEDLDVRNYVVVGNSYGYSAIAVTPYAILTDSWVFLADRVNIAEIDAIMSRRGVDNLVVVETADAILVAQLLDLT